MNSALVDEFGAANMDLIINDVTERLGIVEQELPMDIITAVTKVIEVLMDDTKLIKSY